MSAITLSNNSSEMKSEVEENFKKIPIIKTTKVVSGVDRYGFSSLLATQIGYKIIPRSFANWQHGWIWWGAKSSEELMIDKSLKNESRFIVSKDAEKNILKAEGFKKVWVGGLPFAYTVSSNLNRVAGSLLAMPTHTAEQTDDQTKHKFKNFYIEYLDYLESIKEQYSSVWVSVYDLDHSQELVNEIMKRGLYPIKGAQHNDMNCLQRMRSIFDTFEFVTSDSIGSHIIYSMYSGCKVSICGPDLLQVDSDFRVNEVSKSFSENYIKTQVYYSSRKYVTENFKFLFVDKPSSGFCSEEYAKKAIGFNNKLQRDEILEALQWGLVSQIRGYTEGAIRRVRRVIQAP